MEQLNTWNFPIFDLVEKIGRKCGRILSQVRNAFMYMTLNVGKIFLSCLKLCTWLTPLVSIRWRIPSILQNPWWWGNKRNRNFKWIEYCILQLKYYIYSKTKWREQGYKREVKKWSKFIEFNKRKLNQDLKRRKLPIYKH